MGMQGPLGDGWRRRGPGSAGQVDLSEDGRSRERKSQIKSWEVEERSPKKDGHASEVEVRQ